MGMVGTTTTYSFEDVTGAMAHPLLGAYTFDGKGCHDITITMSEDMTKHDRAADGSIMVTKMKGEPGKLSLTVQQTSIMHKWLLGAYQAVKVADSSNWASMAATIRCVADGTSHILTGGSFTKIPEKKYTAEGQQVTWEFMFADIQSVPL